MSNLKSLRKMLKLNVDKFMEEKQDIGENLVSIIEDMNSQACRIESCLDTTKEQQAKVQEELQIVKDKIDKLNNDANNAREHDDKALANTIAKTAKEANINLLHKEELYKNLSIQSVQLKEQLDVLNEKLLEVLDAKKQHNNSKEQPKPFTDVIMDRLMKEIRDSQNI